MELGFLLKKFIGFCMLPLSLCILFMTLGLILLWLNKYKTAGKTLCTIALLALIFFSWNPTANTLLRPMEHSIAIFDINTKVDYVMVLGNKVNADSQKPIINQLSSTALKRLLEGIRILNAQPDSQLIVSGYDNNNMKSCAEAYAEAAVFLGISNHRITQLTKPKDTKEEAIAAKHIVQNKTVALVTSASHMPRALEYFKQQGINVIPAPSNHLTLEHRNTTWMFNAQGLQKSETAFYERLGQAWQWLTK
jgi:uncharacterized SAM-binding protein YcdF (DUF218 family)